VVVVFNTITALLFRVAEFQIKLSQFRTESNAAKKHNENALNALYADNSVSNILAFKLHQELEFRRKCSKAKLRWIHAINKVMVQNYVEKVYTLKSFAFPIKLNCLSR